MFISKHSKFILTPISDILQDATNSGLVLSYGIECYPIIEYILQAVFLRMTGFLEQKGKCLCWDVATNDLDFRYDVFINQTKGCSKQNNKSKVYSIIMAEINKKDSNYSLKDKSKDILISSKKEIINLLKKSFLIQSREADFLFFKNEELEVHNQFIQDHSRLFENNQRSCFLFKIYEQLQQERNRCAHNLKSYQQNLPDLSSMCNEENKYNNYFYYLWLLVSIDKVYIELFNKVSQQNYYQ